MLESIVSSQSPTGAQPPQLTKIVVCELSSDLNHAVSVAQAFGVGYGIDNSGTKSDYTINGVTFNTSLNIYNFINERIIFTPETINLPEAIEFAYENIIRVVVCSDTIYTGNNNPTYYPQVQLITPIGSNSHIELSFNPNTESNTITTGSSTTDSTLNGTAYGKALTFFDTYDGESSFSNGYIGGKILYIKEQRSTNAGIDLPFWDARYAAMQTADYNPSFPAHDLNNGWGKINVAAAIAYAGTVPADPYL